MRFARSLARGWTRWSSEVFSLKNERPRMIRQGAIALLGRADKPTDGVEEYCNHLDDALRGRGISLAIQRDAWEKRGWRRASRPLRRHARPWKAPWVLVQYTASARSARGVRVLISPVLRPVH